MPLKWQRALLWAAVLALAAVIFAFSAQPGPASDGMTEAAVSPLIDLIVGGGTGGEDAWQRAYIIVGTLARKAAHVAEYALLGLLVTLLMRSYGLRGRLLPILVCIAYAASDEIHQAFVPGRLGAPVDVLIDGAGVTLGVMAAGFLSHFRRK